MKPKVVHVNSKEWLECPPEKRKYIGREVRKRGFKESIWANPYKITKDKSRKESLSCYRKLMVCWVREVPGKFNLNTLTDMLLGCWCHPQICHGDILVELWEKYVGGKE